jgi:hypothetical protein
MKTFMSGSLTLPRKQVAKFDQVKTEDLDLRQNAVQGRPVRKTREQCVASLKLCDHGRKGRLRRWTEMAGDPKCVQIRGLAHTPIISARQVRSHHQDLVSRPLRVLPLPETGRTMPGTNYTRSTRNNQAESTPPRTDRITVGTSQ